jgi:TRAP transporter TAXI family solute receptor
MKQCIRLLSILVLSLAGLPGSIAAQTDVQSQEDRIKERKNRNTVGLAAGQLGAAYPRLSQDLAKVLDDGDELRVIPMITYGSVGNVMDLLYLRNVDIAFTKADNFEFYKKKLNINLANRIHFITRLYDAELHIVVRPEIKSLEDLRGKKVNVGLPGNAAHTTVPIVMEALGIEFEILAFDHAIGLEMMKKGEISGAMRVGGKPMSTFTTAPKGEGFHFLSITPSQFAQHFADKYVLGKLTHEDYPDLIPAGDTVTTVAVPDILAVYNWPTGTDRYRRVEKFITALFEKFDQLRTGPFHEKWKDVNLASTIPGWTRSEIAERMLQKVSAEAATGLRADFEVFLKTNGDRAAGPLNAKERDVLFKQFMSWRQSQNQ